jgi:tRNA A37 threonylcarbamoyladenosine dehydratase
LEAAAGSGTLAGQMVNDSELRFGGMARLYGRAGLKRLRAAHVLVVGVGGVGSWTVEALARSGVGTITMVDLDEICVSNVNRQLPALDGTIGRPKVEVLAERIRAINPACRIFARQEFFTEDSAERLLGPTARSQPDTAPDSLPATSSGGESRGGEAPLPAGASQGEGVPPGPASGFAPTDPPVDFVVDAIDAVANKCRLIALCRARRLPVIVCGGAGGRRDPTQVRRADLALATHDRLLSEVRKRLRQEHGFPPAGKKFGVDCICSAEIPVFPQKDGSVCPAADAPAEPGESRRLNCDWGFGSATHVTGTFGFAAAAAVINALAEGKHSSK